MEDSAYEDNNLGLWGHVYFKYREKRININKVFKAALSYNYA